MLLSFSVENFRSFQAEETLNLLAAKGFEAEHPHYCEIPNTKEHALRVASLYGANGAGKSNLVQAIALLKRLVLHGTSPGETILYKPFLLDNESPSKPTSFELQFLQEGEVFRYGMCYDADRIHEEWLSVYEGKKERNLFTRVTEKDGAVTVSLGATAKDTNVTKKIKALAEVGARPNQLFLTEVVNLDDPGAQGPRFQQTIEWFTSTLAIAGPDASFLSLAQTIASDETFGEFAGRFLREAGTGIAGLEVETREMSRSQFSAISPEMVKNTIKDLPSEGALYIQSPDGEEVFLEGPGKDVVKLRKIVALHDADKETAVRFPLHEESDGSQRLLNLLPVLYRLAADGGVFLIDELERSMHPMLARKFIEFFLKAVPEARSQLIFTTHESTLLDLDLMRRDGIWFAEKDQKGATHLYSLADFKVRTDLRIDKGYLAGRFGAIPFLGGIDHLIEERAAAEAEA